MSKTAKRLAAVVIASACLGAAGITACAPGASNAAPARPNMPNPSHDTVAFGKVGFGGNPECLGGQVHKLDTELTNYTSKPVQWSLEGSDGKTIISPHMYRSPDGATKRDVRSGSIDPRDGVAINVLPKDGTAHDLKFNVTGSKIDYRGSHTMPVVIPFDRHPCKGG